MWGTVRNIFGEKGNMEHNFWEHGNSVKVNFGEHLNLFLRNKGKTVVNFDREQGSMLPPPPPEALYIRLDAIREPLNFLKTNLHF